MTRSIPVPALVLAALACAKQPQISPEQARREFTTAASREQVVEAARAALRDWGFSSHAVGSDGTVVIPGRPISAELGAITVHGEKVSHREVGEFPYSGSMYRTVIDMTVVEVGDSTRVTIVPTRYFSPNRWAPRHPEPVGDIEVEMSLRLAKSIEKALSKNNS
jgi:hypothetical protein